MKQQALSEEQIAHIACCLSYDPWTGVISTIKGSNTVKAGQEAGYLENNGYRRIKLTLKGKTFRVLAHLVAWFLYYGYWPKHRVDHEDRVRNNNTIFNLRKAVGGQNAQNSVKNVKNKTGYKGVMQTGKKYYGQIWFNGGHAFSKSYATAREAHLWYLEMQHKHHKEFAAGANDE